jgi:hypothetical protein
MSEFNHVDYNSPDGMVTSVWGPLAWNFLHIISFNYPMHPTAEEKQHYKAYLLSLGNVLPCSYCRKNFKNNLEKTGFNDGVFDSRESLSKFIYKLHNCVNKMLGKPIELTYNDVRARYENFRARCINEVAQEKTKEERGCLNPMYGKKSKCVIHIVPSESRTESFKMDSRCMLRRGASKKRSTRRSSRSRAAPRKKSNKNGKK